jgi:hypothetical protein
VVPPSNRRRQEETTNCVSIFVDRKAIKFGKNGNRIWRKLHEPQYRILLERLKRSVRELMMQVPGGAAQSANLGQSKNKHGYTAFESSFKNARMA